MFAVIYHWIHVWSICSLFCDILLRVFAPLCCCGFVSVKRETCYFLAFMVIFLKWSSINGHLFACRNSFYNGCVLLSFYKKISHSGNSAEVLKTVPDFRQAITDRLNGKLESILFPRYCASKDKVAAKATIHTYTMSYFINYYYCICSATEFVYTQRWQRHFSVCSRNVIVQTYRLGASLTECFPECLDRSELTRRQSVKKCTTEQMRKNWCRMGLV